MYNQLSKHIFDIFSINCKPCSPLCLEHLPFKEEIQTLNFNIYNINKVIIQTQKYLSFPQLNKQAVLRRKPERWQGLPHINMLKQYETVLSLMVSLLI